MNVSPTARLLRLLQPEIGCTAVRRGLPPESLRVLGVLAGRADVSADALRQTAERGTPEFFRQISGKV